MNWGELKNEVRDLGFEENESLEEYRDILLSAANRAMGMINATIPLTARYDFTQDGTESGLKRYDMAELTKEDGPFCPSRTRRSGSAWMGLMDPSTTLKSKWAEC